MKRSLLTVLAISLVLLLFGAGLAEASLNHTVQRGDTLWRISQQYETTVTAVAGANNLSDVNLIYPGQTLVIPGVHRVIRGETLWSLSQRYGTTVAAIAAASSLSNANLIYPGQLLKIPGQSGGAGVAVTPPSTGELSSADMELFARLVHSEAAGEPYVGQVAVAASVLNRVKDSRYPNTVRAVILQVVNGYYQYSPVLDGRINLPANETALRAVRDALNGADPSLGATGFYNPAKTSNQWVRNQPVTTTIGNHVFFR